MVNLPLIPRKTPVGNIWQVVIRNHGKIVRCPCDFTEKKPCGMSPVDFLCHILGGIDLQGEGENGKSLPLCSAFLLKVGSKFRPCI